VLSLNRLTKCGYFPKELPPPFTTESLADNIEGIYRDWGSIGSDILREHKESQCVKFTIPRLGFSRRILGIPNPLHQIELSKCICDNWSEINRIFNGSRYSKSMPVVKQSSDRAVTTKNTYPEFKHESILNSHDKLYVLTTDISRYYPTIYTHIVPWVIHGKDIAKSRRNDFTLLGNKLDKYVRVGQSSQTFGIPIGPDTSLIISEIILCTLDKEIQSRYSELNMVRYYDDYLLNFEDYAQAEDVFKCIQRLLNTYHLEINEEKTKIDKEPISFEEPWAIHIGSFSISNHPNKQKNDIYNYFSLAFKYSKECPKFFVLKYAIRKIMNYNI